MYNVKKKRFVGHLLSFVHRFLLIIRNSSLTNTITAATTLIQEMGMYGISRKCCSAWSPVQCPHLVVARDTIVSQAAP